MACRYTKVSVSIEGVNEVTEEPLRYHFEVLNPDTVEFCEDIGYDLVASEEFVRTGEYAFKLSAKKNRKR